MSTLNVDKVDPSSGTALELGTSGDTITVPTGAGLTVTDEVKTNKVPPATGTAFALGDSGDTFTVPSGATIVNSGTATGFGITQTNFTPNAQPIFYNGEMTVSQRGNATGITNANSGYYGPDRYKLNEDGTMTAILSITQETLTSGNAWADGFNSALKYDVTTADASVAADIYARIEQRFEKGDLSLFKKGTSGAETYTLAFWVKATVTGTNVVELQDQVNTRHCCASYTVSSTDTWEHKVLNFAADTSGPLGNGNGIGMQVNFALQAGTNYTSGTLATAWAASTDANRAVGQVNNFSSTSNNFHITGVQLEVGTYTSSDLPPFQHESYGDNLFRCERYYQVISKKRGSSYENEVVPATQYDSSQFYATYLFRTVMRTPPTLESASGTNYFTFYRNGANVQFDDYLLDKSSVYSVSIYKGSVSGTGGDGGWTRWVNNAPDNSLVALTGEL